MNFIPCLFYLCRTFYCTKPFISWFRKAQNEAIQTWYLTFTLDVMSILYKLRPWQFTSTVWHKITIITEWTLLMPMALQFLTPWVWYIYMEQMVSFGIFLTFNQVYFTSYNLQQIQNYETSRDKIVHWIYQILTENSKYWSQRHGRGQYKDLVLPA